MATFFCTTCGGGSSKVPKEDLRLKNLLYFMSDFNDNSKLLIYEFFRRFKFQHILALVYILECVRSDTKHIPVKIEKSKPNVVDDDDDVLYICNKKNSELNLSSSNYDDDDDEHDYCECSSSNSNDYYYDNGVWYKNLTIYEILEIISEKVNGLKQQQQQQQQLENIYLNIVLNNLSSKFYRKLLRSITFNLLPEHLQTFRADIRQINVSFETQQSLC